MKVRIVGEHPLARDECGAVRARIGTVFPRSRTIVTVPGIHATQRVAYVELLNQERQSRGLPPLSEDQQLAEWEGCVDLIMQDDQVLIRPDPQNMALAFEADELLQELIPKPKIKFLYVLNDAVRQAIKRRGECWRISPLPRSSADMNQMIRMSRIGISGRPIYYYNTTTGTRYLTCQEFSGLARLGDEELRRHMIEIRESLGRCNRLGHAEIELFLADRAVSAADFMQHELGAMRPEQIRAAHQALAQKFRAAVRPEFQEDSLGNTEWRNRMCAALIGHSDEAVSEESLLGLSSEFYMQIEWLPGGRIEEGELIFDSVFEDENGAQRYDPKPRAFIFNFIREYGDIEYINIGRVVSSLSRRRPVTSVSGGRRDVYIAEIKLKGVQQEIVRMIRMQKWGVREHLNEGKSLLDCIIESEDYTEYTLDRRLGCRQLGMHLPARLTARKISEVYDGSRKELAGTHIWSPYFERDYIRGIATDKLPGYRFEDEAFALRFARLLGQAAASNIIVGRSDLEGHVVFDDGDEVVIEDAAGGIAELVVTDHTGTFMEYRRELASFAAEYAEPINSRLAHVRCPQAFAAAYVGAFVERFGEIQQEYRKRRRAFAMLFSHRRRDEAGSFAYRWELVLRRLDETDPQALGEEIRRRINV